MSKKHVATFPLYATCPITLRVTRRRIGTGYIYDYADLVKREAEMARKGHPVHLRWRNEECRIRTLAEAFAEALS